MKRFLSLRGVLVLVLLTMTASMLGQITASSSVQGTVTDATGAVVVGAAVTATSSATGQSRTTTTNDTGGYRFDSMAPGAYIVKVNKAGFATQTAAGVELIVSRTTTQNFALKAGAASETIEVTAEAPVLDVEKSSVGLDITPTHIENLPLNGRDFANLAYLAPGVKPVSSYDPTKNRIAVFAVNGSTGRNVNVTVNGIDDKDNTVGGPVMQLPLEAVQEFNIATQRFSAANGRSEGAAVNVITKSGSNSYHGSIYVFDTETALNALDHFSEPGPKPDFSRQQFGGSIGGPVRKDKDFLFFALERLREHTATPVTARAFAELTAASSAGLPAQPVNSIPTPYFDWRYTGRYDHHINNNNSFFVTYSNQHNNSLNDQDGNTTDATQNNFTTNQLILANATLNSVLTPRVVNALTFGFQYWNNVIDSGTKVPLFTFPDAQFGTNTNVAQQSFQRKWQFKDDISFTRGNHSLKTGVDYLYEPTLGGYFQSNGTLTFSFFDDPSAILANKGGLYPQGFKTPGAVQTMSQSGGDPKFLEHAKMFGLYFQDDWKLRHNLTLNLGLRYDKDSGLFGEDSIAKNRTYLELKAINSVFASKIPHQDNLDFSPRVGFAWDVTGAGRHVVRGGYGLYYGQTFENVPLFMIQQANPSIYAQLFSIQHSGVTASCSVSVCAVPGTSIPLSSYRLGVDPLPTLPPAKTALPAGAVGRIMDPNYRNPYSQQWNLGYAFEVNPASVIEVDYVHELGLHESKRININYIDPATGSRVLASAFTAASQTQLANITDDGSFGRSRYDGLNLSYRRRMAKNFSWTSTYTLSWALGYQGGAASFGNVAVIPTAPLRSQDFGYVASDERHRWVNSLVVNLPWGFQFAPIMQWASARPFNPTEGITDVLGYGAGNGAFHAIGLAPDPLHTLQSTASMTAAQLRTCLAAATCQEVHFDTLRGQAFFQVDNRVTKSFKFGERGNLKLMFQGFDLTNRANFGNTFGTNIRTSTFGVPTGYITPAGTIVPKSFRAEFGAQFTF